MEWLEVFKGKKLGVVGKIAAGKTTLVNNMSEFLRNHGLTVFAEVEVVDNNLLSTYCEDPARYSEVFQTERLMACHYRQQIVEVQRSAFGPTTSVGIVERPLYENRLFANANHRMGWLSTEYLENFYTPLMEQRNNFPCDLLIYLFTTDSRSKSNQENRGREGEDKYSDMYLAYLGDEYFNFVSDHVSRGKCVVVDWTNFGDTEALLQVVAQALARPDLLPRVTRLDSSSDDELRNSAGVLRIHESDGARDYPLDIAPEQNRSHHDRAFRALAEFRDIEITTRA
jgi:deoxyadenosine/deoxycytidine kinase